MLRPGLLLVFMVLLGGCATVAVTASPAVPSGNPSAEPTAAVASPSPTTTEAPSASPNLTIDCGVLLTDQPACVIAAATAFRTPPAGHGMVTAVRIEPPLPHVTCPPGLFCPPFVPTAITVILVMVEGELSVPLVRTADGWIPAALVR